MRNQQHLKELATVIASEIDENVRIQLAVKIGKICESFCSRAFSPAFDWKLWNEACKVDFKDNQVVHQERNTMTRKHFVKLALAISEIPIKRDRIEFARVVGDMCSARNCHFDDSRWNEACRV